MRENNNFSGQRVGPTNPFVEFKKEEVEQSIPDRFKQMVHLYSDRLAVKTRNHQITYDELNKDGNRVAHAIIAERGDEPEPVGLLFTNGASLMAAILGVLKAGKYFVLLDPSFPRKRISAVLDDSQAGLVVTDQQNVSLARDVVGSSCRLIEFEAIDSGLPIENLGLFISPSAHAVSLYTSGSTGQPKGVIQNHRNLLHQIMLYTDEYHVCAEDRLILLTSGTCNTVTYIFIALLNGAALLPFDVRKEGVSRLASWLLQEKISICCISSPLFRNLCGTLTGEERFPDLRLLGLTSEAVYKTDFDLYNKYFSPDCVMTNGLASTEAWLLRLNVLDHNAEIAGTEVPVGYPVEDKEILLLDDEGREVGFNQVGEIVVRSKYLSAGYWNNPELTAAKFKPDAQDPEKRFYFTGDLGLMLPDGCLIHKGRKDLRVKIRGYGVELAEVEKALRNHTGIKEVVVVTLQTESGETRLVGYFTSHAQRSPSVNELRSCLKGKLPDYMIPSAFVMLDALPLTPAGKIDRKALPFPSSARPELDTSFVAPTTPVEEELVKIWAEVLPLDQVGIQDNFFDLGGHSLAATRVISRVINTFKVEVPIKSLFESPTVADMAVVITENMAKKARDKELARMLTELESLSDEEARKQLADEEAKEDSEK